MAPKKRKVAAAPKARAKSTIENSVLTSWKPPHAASEVCGACLLPIESGASVGRIDSCAHAFHFSCAERWSQTENSCPQCKLRFFWLACYSPAGERASLQRVKQRDQEVDEEDGFETIQACEVCKEVGDEGALLLCDGMHGTCNAAYHYSCVGLGSVPKTAWFCPDCVDRGFDVDARGRRGRKQGRFPATDSMGLEVPSSSASSFSVADASVSSAPAPAAAQQAAASQQSETETERAMPEAAASLLARAREEVAAVEVGGAASAAVGSSSPREGVLERPPPQPQAAQAGPVHPFEQAPPAPPSQRQRSGRASALPANLRLSALTCVTPLVDLPAFQPGSAPALSGEAAAGSSGRSGGAGGAGGLFASFVQRRKQQRGEGAAKGEAAASFIKLNPTYEEDFMGK